MGIETQLRAALRDEASTLAAPETDPYARVAAAVGRNRRHRRVIGAGLVAVVAAIAVGVPTVMSRLDDPVLPAGQHQPLPSADDPMWNSVSTWPTRGSLADDARFLSSMRGEDSTIKQIVFAGDVDDDRLVIAAVEPGSASGDSSFSDPSSVELKTFFGPRGSGAAALEAGEWFPVTNEGGIITVRRDQSPDAWMLVLATPDERTAEVSPRLDVTEAGTTTRAPWQSVALRDGFAVVPLRDAPPVLTMLRLGDYEGSVGFAVSGSSTSPFDAFDGLCHRLCPEFTTEATSTVDAAVAQTFGVAPEEVDTTVVHNVDVSPSVAALVVMSNDQSESDVQGEGGTFRLFVAHSRLPNGAVVRTSLLSYASRTESNNLPLGFAVPIDAATAADRPFALAALNPETNRVVAQVWAPRASKLRVATQPQQAGISSSIVRADGGALTTLPMTSLKDLSVTTYGDDGRELGQWLVNPPPLNDLFPQIALTGGS